MSYIDFTKIAKGTLRYAEVPHLGNARVTSGKKALVLSGSITHVNGTASNVVFSNEGGEIARFFVDSTAASGVYNLFTNGGWQPIILSPYNGVNIIFFNASGGKVQLQLLEWYG